MPALHAAILQLALLAAAPPPAHTPPERLLAGGWGGRGVALQVSSEGARLELDCAHGTIRPPLRIDESGGFRLHGTFVQERPGPARPDRSQEGGPGLHVRSQ